MWGSRKVWTPYFYEFSQPQILRVDRAWFAQFQIRVISGVHMKSLFFYFSKISVQRVSSCSAQFVQFWIHLKIFLTERTSNSCKFCKFPEIFPKSHDVQQVWKREFRKFCKNRGRAISNTWRKRLVVSAKRHRRLFLTLPLAPKTEGQKVDFGRSTQNSN